MFQYEFFSLKDYLKYRIPHPFPMRRMPRSFVRTRDIRWIRSSYWAEHCLECGAPQCYGTCPNYQLRGDNGCRLLRYGMYNAFIINGCIGLIQEWVNDRRDLTVESISELTATLILASVGPYLT